MTTPTASVPTTSPEWEQAQLGIAEFVEGVTVPAITNPDEHAVAAKQLVTIKAHRKRLDEARKEITDPLTQAHKAAMAQYKSVDGPLEQVDRDIRRSVSVYTTETVRQLREQQAEKQAEVDRLAREDADRAQEAEAARLEKAGRTEEAEEAIAPAVVERAVQERQTYVSTTPAKVEDVSMRKQPHVKIEAPKKLPREYLMPDEKKIKGVVKALKYDHGIPGVKYWETDEPVVRS